MMRAIDAICNWAIADLSVEKLSMESIHQTKQALNFCKCGFTLEGTLKEK